jgi:hypothetical protein
VLHIKWESGEVRFAVARENMRLKYQESCTRVGRYPRGSTSLKNLHQCSSSCSNISKKWDKKRKENARSTRRTREVNGREVTKLWKGAEDRSSVVGLTARRRYLLSYLICHVDKGPGFFFVNGGVQTRLSCSRLNRWVHPLWVPVGVRELWMGERESGEREGGAGLLMARGVTKTWSEWVVAKGDNKECHRKKGEGYGIYEEDTRGLGRIRQVNRGCASRQEVVVNRRRV